MGKTRKAVRVSYAAGRRAARRLAARFALASKGATAIEYGLIAALIAVGIIVALTAVSGTIQDNLYNKVQTSLTS